MTGKELARVRVSTLEAFLEQPIEVADHLPVRGQVVLGGRADGVRQALHVLVEDGSAQALHQGLKALTSAQIEEVVFAEPADLPADVGRQLVELSEATLDDGTGGLSCRVRRGGGGPVGRGIERVDPMLDRRALLVHDRLELLADPGQHVAQLAPSECLLTSLPQALQELSEARQGARRRVGRGVSSLEQAPQRLVEVALGHEVVGQRIYDLVGIEGGDCLRPIPARVANGTDPTATRSGTLRGLSCEVAGIRRVGGHRR